MAQTGMVAGGRLTGWISVGVLTSWVPADAVDDAIEATGTKAQRWGVKLRRGWWRTWSWRWRLAKSDHQLQPSSAIANRRSERVRRVRDSHWRRAIESFWRIGAALRVPAGPGRAGGALRAWLLY